jgi:methionyl-tRNA formyltransferase
MPSDSPPRPLVAVVLAERLARADDLHHRLDGIAGVEVRALVCRNARPRARFVAGVLLDCARRPRVAARVLTRRWGLSVRSLDDPGAARFLRRVSPDVGLHAMSVIYRAGAIAAFRLGILNAHLGLLPAYRGRSVVEWALLAGDPTGITTFFVDEGIDTGPEIVVRAAIDVAGCADRAAAKRRLGDHRTEQFATALRALAAPGFRAQRQALADGRRHYVMSDLLGGVVDDLLRDAEAGG